LSFDVFSRHFLPTVSFLSTYDTHRALSSSQERLLEEKGLDKTSVDAIVIVGGGVRIPAIQQKIKDFMGMELAQNLNGTHTHIHTHTRIPTHTHTHTHTH
jgi:hypothetical protein